ncbi:hypothetical protein ETB97_003324 [Aspergillus alliaceus]|uniref:Transcription factor domain-containing protein n=1 Tax=Petromyces alliaceus TaxID=209559 RepID=A0A8H6E4F6_PETAA|nr:hypothetical protein ETB97_003324 [Aspergillus burnettii]
MATNKTKSRNETKPEGADVLSGLFRAQQKPPLPDNVVDMHREIFQKQFAIHGQGPGNTTFHPASDESTASPPVLDQIKADQLLSKFRIKSGYFPFVAIPENIASTDHRFLYLGVLTVASSDDIPLLRSLDHRFRSVLADRVVKGGEKSLDYLQGLLVYIAWYNLNLNPRSFQLYQYLQIAISIMVDLRLNDGPPTGTAFDPPLPYSVAAAKDACLGCYFLSSAMATGSKRPNNVVLCNDLKSYLFQLAEAGCPKDQTKFQYIRLQTAIESAYKGCDRPTIIWPANSCLMLDRTLNTASIGIAQLALSFLVEASLYIREPMLLECDICRFQSIMTRGKAFLDHFLSISVPEFSKFSFAEWGRLITVIRVLTEILSASAGLPAIVVAAVEESRQLSIYLDCLANRMEKLSKSGRNPGDFPDVFYLFKSVLDILSPLPLATNYDNDPQFPLDSEPEWKMNRCPVLAGIQDTDFWNAYQISVPPHDIGADFDMLLPNDDCLLGLPLAERTNPTQTAGYP